MALDATRFDDRLDFLAEVDRMGGRRRQGFRLFRSNFGQRATSAQEQAGQYGGMELHLA